WQATRSPRRRRTLRRRQVVRGCRPLLRRRRLLRGRARACAENRAWHDSAAVRAALSPPSLAFSEVMHFPTVMYFSVQSLSYPQCNHDPFRSAASVSSVLCWVAESYGPRRGQSEESSKARGCGSYDAQPEIRMGRDGGGRNGSRPDWRRGRG